MTDRALNPVDIDIQPAAQPHRRPQLRVALEFAVLFAAAFFVKHVILGGSSGVFPSPYWFPVVVLSLQYGLTAGLAAALTAVGLDFATGLPPAVITEDVYDYIGRITAQPAAWTCVALLIGHTRSREIERVTDLEARLTNEIEHSTAVADLCAKLRQRSQMLESHIAANPNLSVIDIAEAITRLYDARWNTIAERIARFIATVMGTADFSVYLLRGNRLKRVFPSEQVTSPVLSATVEPDSPVFSAVVREGRTLWASRPEDRALIGDHEVLIGPLTEEGAPDHVIGMLVSGTDLADFQTDVERRFTLARAQLSRVLTRAVLIDDWHTDPPGDDVGRQQAAYPFLAPDLPDDAKAAPDKIEQSVP